MDKKMIFAVEDERHILELLEYNIKNAGYDFKGFDTAEAVFRELENSLPSLILLDLMLPDMNGLEVCKQLKQNPRWADIPITMLTAKNEEIDKILGLEIGADDYVTKPFSVRELIARISAILRRSEYHRKNHGTLIKLKDIELDLARREMRKGGKYLKLTLKEFELLHILMANCGVVMTREQLLDKVWGYEFFGETRTVDVHIRRLRNLIGDKGEDYIETVRGVGYRFCD